jgi:peptide/nickel transport system permease protein
MENTGRRNSAESLKDAEQQAPQKKSSVLRGIVRFIRTKPLGAFGALIVILLLLIAIFADVLAPRHYSEIDVPNRLSSPSSEFYFGTDEQGRDVFSRVIYGARTSVLIAFSAIAVMTIIATTIGIISGFYGGTFDIIVQRVVDIWLALPGLVFVIFIVAIFGATTFGLAIIIGILMAAGASRIVRGATIAIRDSQYVESARAIGASDLRIIARHLFPNVTAVIIISASVQIGSVILLETSLSFLGFGAPPPMPSWGRMLQQAQVLMQQNPHMALFPGLAITVTVFGLNMFGDALRDILDPRLRGSR